MSTIITVTQGQDGPVNLPDGATVGTSRLINQFTDLRLRINQSGQTRWNLGGSEPRQHLYVNGIRATRNVDYSIDLPYLDWLAPVGLETTDELVLTV